MKVQSRALSIPRLPRVYYQYLQYRSSRRSVATGLSILPAGIGPPQTANGSRSLQISSTMLSSRSSFIRFTRIRPGLRINIFIGLLARSPYPIVLYSLHRDPILSSPFHKQSRCAVHPRKSLSCTINFAKVAFPILRQRRAYIGIYTGARVIGFKSGSTSYQP